MDKITREELTKLGGAPDATHAVFYADGQLYMCANMKAPDEDHEAAFWKERGMTFKRVVES